MNIEDYFIRDEEAPITKLKPNPKNPRRHPERLLKSLELSMTKFGKTMPMVVDEDYNIIAGHARLKVAQNLGLETFPVRVFKFTPQLAEMYMLADNKLAELSEWDEDLVAEMLEALEYAQADLELTGFSSAEIDEALAELRKGTDEDDIDNILEEVEQAEPISKRGDVYSLGKHRLMCGDSTVSDVVNSLMTGTTANLFFTDPPYGVSYGDKNAFLNAIGRGNCIQDNIEGDTLTVPQMKEMWVSAFTNALAVTNEGGSYYVCSPQGGELMMMMMMSLLESGWLLKHSLIWVKNNIVLGRSDYNYQHEPILYGWKEGAAHSFYGAGGASSVWEINKSHQSKLHPTMKPIELCVKAIENSSKRGEIVLDLFGGAGSTLIACEQTGRTCYMMEIDPHYVDVIIKRWEQYTNQKATLIENKEVIERVDQANSTQNV